MISEDLTPHEHTINDVHGENTEPVKENQVISYKDAVINKANTDIYFDDSVNVWSEDEEENNKGCGGTPCIDLNDTPQEEDPLCPVVCIPPKHVEKLRRRWKDSTIVRLLGKSIGLQGSSPLES